MLTLSAEKKDLKTLTCRKNLIKHGFLSDQVGSLVQYKKFHKGKVTKPKITDEGAEYWSDSEDDSFEEDLDTGAIIHHLPKKARVDHHFCY